MWPSTECHSLIFVWYDAEGRDPLFPLEEIEEVKRGRWRFRSAWCCGGPVQRGKPLIQAPGGGGVVLMRCAVIRSNNIFEDLL